MQRPVSKSRFKLALCAVICVLLLSLSAGISFAQMNMGLTPAAAAPTPAPFMTPRQMQKKVIDTVSLLVIAYFILFVLIRITNKRIPDIRLRHTVRKNTVYIVNFLAIAGVILIWLQNIGSFTILVGFLSAGLALALQEVILSVAGWVLIVTRRPFEAGDRIELNGVKGDVIDIRLFQTALLEIGNWVDADQSTGRIVNIPNSFVFKSPHYNYSRGFEFIWNEIPVLLTFESDWHKAHAILTGIVEEQEKGLPEKARRKIEVMKDRYMIYYGKLTPIVYVNIKASGVELTIRYLTEAQSRRSSQDKICRQVLDAVNREPDINFAYPTYRIVKE